MEKMEKMGKTVLQALCLTAALLTVAAASLHAQAVTAPIGTEGQAEKTPDGLQYKNNERGGVTVTGYTGTAAALAIPAAIGGLPVTEIGWGAFERRTGLTSVTIPDSVTEIGDNAFAGYGGLTNIAVDPGNTTYTSVDGVMFTKDKKTLIAYPVGRKGAYTIPSSVTAIGDGAFRGCTGLTNVVIPAGVTSIGHWAFRGCTGLTNVVIPAGVTSIGNVAFSGCTGLTGINIPAGVTSIGNVAFGGCTGLTGVTIPGSVTSIGDWAFAYCSSLTSVTIPGSVTAIGASAFLGCTGLTNVVIPSSVTAIGDEAFFVCTGLTSVTLSRRTTFGSGAFPSGARLTYAESGPPAQAVPDGLRYERVGRFHIDLLGYTAGIMITRYTGKAASLGIPAAIDGQPVTTIADGVFEGCTTLTSLAIPASVKGIGNPLFYMCTSLTNIAVDPGNTAYTSVDGVLFNKNKTILIAYPVGRKGAYTIPSSVTNIGQSAFRGCTGLTGVRIPTSVTEIGDSAFAGCGGLTSITIPNSVTRIGYMAFWRCTGFTNITIPSSVVEISGRAFDDTRLISVTLSRRTIGDGASFPNRVRVIYSD